MEYESHQQHQNWQQQNGQQHYEQQQGLQQAHHQVPYHSHQVQHFQHQFQRHLANMGSSDFYDAKYMPVNLPTYPTPSTTPYYFHEDAHGYISEPQQMQQLPQLMNQQPPQSYYSWSMPHSYQYPIAHSQLHQQNGQGVSHLGTITYDTAVAPQAGAMPTVNHPGALSGHLLDPNPFENVHKCHFCEKAFKRKSWLKRHLLSHSTMKPYSCPWCHSRHKRKDNLSQHLKLKHVEMLLERLSGNHSGARSVLSSRLDSDVGSSSGVVGDSFTGAHSGSNTFNALSIKDMIDSGVLNKNDVKKALNSLINIDVSNSMDNTHSVHSVNLNTLKSSDTSTPPKSSRHMVDESDTNLASSATKACSNYIGHIPANSTNVALNPTDASLAHISSDSGSNPDSGSIPPPLAISVAPTMVSSGNLVTMTNLHS